MGILLKNGTLYSGKKADVLIEGQVIKQIGSIPKGKHTVIDCKGLHILPGAIDAHVHFREPGAEHKEDFLSGSKAAVAGGVTSIMDMPNNRPPVVNQENLEQKRALAKKAVCNYGLFVLGCKENASSVGNFTDVPGIKVYLGSTTGNYLTDDLGVLYEIMQNAKRPVVVHAENEQLIRYFSEKYKDTGLHHKMRDALAAVVSVAEVSVIAFSLKKKVHIAHLTSKAEVDYLRKNKSKYVTCEAAPHHLFLDESYYRKHGALGKMNPPLRYKEDVQSLWQGLKDGTVQIVATDHAPHTLEEKKSFTGPSGVPGVQTMLPLMLDAVNKKRLLLKDVVRLCCEAPAKIYGVEKRGSLKKGNYADIAVVDMKKRTTIKNAEQFSKCRWTPFDGISIQGAVMMTFVNGQLVFDKGKVDENKKGVELCFS